LRKSRTKYVILGFLTWGPQSGYDIKKHIDQSVVMFWDESFGQLYPELKSWLSEQVTPEPKRSAHPDFIYWMITLEFGIAEKTAHKEWAHTSLDQFRKWRKTNDT